MVVEEKINSDALCDKRSARVSVIFSFLNEANVLSELLRRVTQTMDQMIRLKSIGSYELIFVDDASSDASHSIISSAIASNPNIFLLRMSRNFGNSECALVGMKHASGDVLVYLDADLQDPPELIADLVLKWQSEDDIEVVHTTRRRRAGESRLKLALTYFGYRLVNKLSDIELPVDSGDFKLLSRRAAKHLFLLDERLPYLRGMVCWIGFKQSHVLYDRDERYDGRENTKFKVYSYRTIRGYLDRALISFSDVPLKIGLLTGIIVSVLSLAYILVIIFQKIMGWHEPGWPALMAAVTFLGGITLSVLGVIGLYIGSIFHHVKGRPMAIVDTITMNRNAKRIEGPQDEY